MRTILSSLTSTAATWEPMPNAAYPVDLMHVLSGRLSTALSGMLSPAQRD